MICKKKHLTIVVLVMTLFGLPFEVSAHDVERGIMAFGNFSDDARILRVNSSALRMFFNDGRIMNAGQLNLSGTVGSGVFGGVSNYVSGITFTRLRVGSVWKKEATVKFNRFSYFHYLNGVTTRRMAIAELRIQKPDGNSPAHEGAVGIVIKDSATSEVLLSIAPVPYVREVFTSGTMISPKTDTNLDGRVDRDDIHKIMAAFDGERGSTRYDRRCDFNNDGAVDIVDLNLALGDMGQ